MDKNDRRTTHDSILRPPRIAPSLCALVLLAILLVLDLSSSSGSRQRRAARGEVDLSAARGEVSLLSGQWELYWGRLLGPDEFSGPEAPRPDAYLDLPAPWTRARVGGATLPTYGCATLRLRVRHGLAGQELGVKLKKVNFAYVLYADSKPIAQAGSVSSSGFEAMYKPQIGYFRPEADETTLTLQVANYYPGIRGGPIDEILFGERSSIDREAELLFIANVSYAGGRMLFVVIFLLVFLILREPAALALSGYCFMLLLRGALSRELLFLRIFPATSAKACLNLFCFATFAAALLNLVALYLFQRRGAAGRADRARGRGPLAYFLADGAIGRTVLATTVFVLVIIAFYACVDTLELGFSYYVFFPVFFFCLIYPAVIIAWRVRKRGDMHFLFWYYLVYAYASIHECLSQYGAIQRGYIYPFFLLGRLFGPGALARIRLTHDFVMYCLVAALILYLLYALILSHVRAGTSASAPGVADAPSAHSLEDQAREYGITERELEIVRMAIQGRTYAEIAEACLVSTSTVKAHLGSVYRKLGVKNKTELASRCLPLKP